MSISKRNGSPYYWYDFTVKGARFRGSTETDDKQLAVAIETRLRDGMLRQGHLGDKPTLSFTEASALFWTDHARYLKAGEVCLKHYCRHLIRIIGASTRFETINDATVARYIAARRGEKARNKKTRISNATINREIMTLANIHSKMHQWGYLTGGITFKKHKLPEEAHRLRWLKPEEAKRLLTACKKPYLRHIVTFALLTGARRANILSVQRDDIDMFTGVIHLRVKSRKPGGKPHTVPLTDILKRFLINEMGWEPGQRGALFARKNGTAFKDLKESFKSACKLAKIENFRFHDLRHTCASWLVQNGVPLATVKEILGHEHITTTMRYAHLHADAKKDGLETITAQIGHIDQAVGRKRKSKNAL